MFAKPFPQRHASKLTKYIPPTTKNKHHDNIFAPKAQTTRAPRGVQKSSRILACYNKNNSSRPNSFPDCSNDEKWDGVQGRRTHQDQISAPTAQTTRNERACQEELACQQHRAKLVWRFTQGIEGVQWAEVCNRLNFPSRWSGLLVSAQLPLWPGPPPSWKLTSRQNYRQDGPNDKKREGLHRRSEHQTKFPAWRPSDQNAQKCR